MLNNLNRAYSNEPIKHTDSSKNQYFQDIQISEERTIKFLEYPDNDQKRIFKTINEIPSKKNFIFNKNTGVPEIKNDEFKSFNTSITLVNKKWMKFSIYYLK